MVLLCAGLAGLGFGLVWSKISYGDEKELRIFFSRSCKDIRVQDVKTFCSLRGWNWRDPNRFRKARSILCKRAIEFCYHGECSYMWPKIEILEKSIVYDGTKYIL